MAATVSSTTAVIPATAVSSTTLQDLPVEVLDYILMKAVVKKVMEKKLAKSAWIDYASRVIKPLRTVWSQWNYRLTTRWFEIVLHRNLNCKEPTAIAVEHIARSRCATSFVGFGRLNNKIYCIESSEFDNSDDASLHVFEGQDMTHCIKIIPMPLMKGLAGMAICKRSNSIYVWQDYPSTWPHGSSIWHLVLDGDAGFKALHWPTYAPSSDFLDYFTIRPIVTVGDLSVLHDGNLLVLRRMYRTDHGSDNIFSVHTPDGLVIRSVKLPRGVNLSNVAMKSNGNFVYAETIPDDKGCIIREVDQDGKEICNFHWLRWCTFIKRKQLFVDACDRAILNDGYHNLVFLDADLNFLEEIEILEKNFVDVLVHAVFDKETSEMIFMYWEGDVFFLKLTL